MGVLFEAKEEQERAGLLEDFLQKIGGCAVIDGGFATQLEIHGASINDPLWSALCLINSPHLISKFPHCDLNSSNSKAMGVLFEAKEEQERAGLLEDFLQKIGGCAVIDGGFATQLEIHGASINDPLWSALCLINSPHLISKFPHCDLNSSNSKAMGVLFEAKEEQERAGLLEDFLQKIGGCAVIDGGFATQLEIHGASINDPLWSALCLINSPHLISKFPHCDLNSSNSKAMGVLFEAKEEQERAGLLEDFLQKIGGCAVIDGGFATQLEIHGASINDPLWSALCLINSPHLISKVHLEYLEAGADIIVTSSYQATLPGFISRGLSLEQGEKLLEKSVKLATEARDVFWETVETIPDHTYNRALVAASIGSYGAYLADGSEYSGCYGPGVDLNKLKDFHRRRLQVLVEPGPDLLAFETIPNKLEAQAVAELLEEENVEIPSWICFSSVDGVNAPSGESFSDCIEVLNKSNRIAAVGINCAPPQFVNNLIQKFNELTEKVIVVYPNSGETWDGVAKRWLPSKCFNDEKFKVLAKRWNDSGAKLIGGCCRTTPSTIRGISKVLKQKN